MMLRQNDTTNIMMTFSVLKSSCVDGEATSSSFEFPPACSRSAIKCGIMHISETHPILHFIPQTHQTSLCKLHFPREKSHNHPLPPLAPAPQKSTTVNVITQESEKYQKVYYKNHLQVLNKCGAQTCLFIWGGRSHSWLAGRTVENKMSPATTALRLELLDWQMGSRVGIHKTQTEIIAAAVAALPSHWVLLLDTSCTGFIGWGGLVFPPYQCCCIGLALFCWQLLEGSVSTFPATLQRDIGKTLFRLQH